MSGVPVQVCTSCGARLFPERLLCPRCGGGEFRIELADRGRVEEVTVLRRAPGRDVDPPVRLATVALEAGPRIVARVEGALDVGDEATVAVVGAVAFVRGE